jgi:hypothetical protein
VIRLAGLVAAAAAFVILATANSGGYRYGASDQAFYGPAIALRLDPSLFPRDRALFAPQLRAWVGGDLFAWMTRATGADLSTVFAATYLVTLLTLASGAVWFARGLGGSWWTAGTLLLLLSLRHQITRTGANSLEGYMHPRVLAYAIGVTALGCALRRKYGWAGAATMGAAIIHPTTALWFAVVVAVAFLSTTIGGRAGRATLATLVPIAFAAPFQPLDRMDPVWLAVLGEKSYLFPSGWPATVWAVNLAYPVVVVLIYRQRRAHGVEVPGERALVHGLLALVALFLLSVPFSAARIALAVQLQIARVFWVLDFAAMAYVAWWLCSLRLMQSRRGRITFLLLLGAASAARGTYVLAVETDRPLARLTLPPTDWTDAMRWLAAQPSSVHVLADPGHAWKYGVGVRQAASRDTFLETVKDSAMAMYDRQVAMRVAERTAITARFDEMTAEEVRALDARFEFDLFVVDAARTFPFPVAYRNARFVIYDLR